MKARGGSEGWNAAQVVVLALLLLVGAARAARADDGSTPASPQGVDTPQDELGAAPEVWDPLERSNRRMLAANLVADRYFLDPLTRAYAFVVPNPARLAVRRLLLNFESPAVFANDLLQLAPVDATVTLTRFAVNTTLGLAGLFDPAEKLGLERHHTDFGQTLAVYGVPSGPYIVLPLLGPTTVRDGSGYVVDFLFQPTTYILPGITLVVFASIHQGSTGLAVREEHANQLQALQASSVDFYAALRSAYYQDRTAAIEARRDRGPAAIARLLGVVSLSAAGGEVSDLPAQPRRQRLEAVALEK